MNGRTVLHLALIASLTACAYPLTALLCVWDGKPAGLSAWGMAGLLALLLWLGLGGILLVRRTYYRHPRWVNSALWTLSALAGVGAAFLAPLDTVFFRILLGAAAAGAFFGGTRLLFLPPETLAHPYVFAGVCTWEVAAGLLLRLHCPDASGLPYVLLLAGQSAVFAAAHNQEALRRVLHSRDGEEWELPWEVQRRNRLLMGALFGIGGLLLLCSKPAAHGVRWLLTKILTVLWAALRWFLNCFSGAALKRSAGKLRRKRANWRSSRRPGGARGSPRSSGFCAGRRLLRCWSGNGGRSGRQSGAFGIICAAGFWRTGTPIPWRNPTTAHTVIMWKIYRWERLRSPVRRREIPDGSGGTPTADTAAWHRTGRSTGWGTSCFWRSCRRRRQSPRTVRRRCWRICRRFRSRRRCCPGGRA